MFEQEDLDSERVGTVVLVCARAEWEVIRQTYADHPVKPSRLGDWFTADVRVEDSPQRVIFFHGGWGKIAAAASTQYVIDRWAPKLVVNLGTCGGFEGEIERGEIVLAERTLVYDIVEQMADHDAGIAYLSTNLKLESFTAPCPQAVRRGLLVSADRDIVAADIPELKARYGAVAADWESGAIAWVTRRNDTRCLILRGVSDLVGVDGGEAYEGGITVFYEGARDVMGRLLDQLPAWLAWIG